MLSRYPQQAVLRDGRKVLIRPVQREGRRGPVRLLSSAWPEETRRFAWDRIDDRSLVERWGLNLDYAKAFPLLAVDNGQIVADATLHRRTGGPLRLVGRIKWLLDPEFRGVGLGTLLISHFVSIAAGDGLRHLTCMLISDLEADAMRTLEEQGFESFKNPRVRHRPRRQRSRHDQEWSSSSSPSPLKPADLDLLRRRHRLRPRLGRLRRLPQGAGWPTCRRSP